MLGIWKGVPVGLACHLNPFFTWLLTAGGAVLSVLILYFFGERIRKSIQTRRKKRLMVGKETRAKHLFQKYGMAGLGFLGTMLMGPNMTIIIGMALVKSSNKLLYWTLGGILFWTAILTLLAYYSLDLFIQLSGN